MTETDKEKVVGGQVAETSSSDSAVREAYQTEYRIVHGTTDEVTEGEIHPPKPVTEGYSSAELAKRETEIYLDLELGPNPIRTLVPRLGDAGDGSEIFQSRKRAKKALAAKKI